MAITITGTPGVGKTSVCKELCKKGCRVISLLDYSIDIGAAQKSKKAGGGKTGKEIEIDTRKLSGRNTGYNNKTIIEGHLAHHIPSSICIVIRLSPGKLEKRLSKRGYPAKKIQANVESEAIDQILVEALSLRKRVFEIDATKKTPSEVARDVHNIITGRHLSKYKPGQVDWSGEVMSWY